MYMKKQKNPSGSESLFTLHEDRTSKRPLRLMWHFCGRIGDLPSSATVATAAGMPRITAVLAHYSSMGRRSPTRAKKVKSQQPGKLNFAFNKYLHAAYLSANVGEDTNAM